MLVYNLSGFHKASVWCHAFLFCYQSDRSQGSTL